MVRWAIPRGGLSLKQSNSPGDYFVSNTLLPDPRAIIGVSVFCITMIDLLFGAFTVTLFLFFPSASYSKHVFFRSLALLEHNSPILSTCEIRQYFPLLLLKADLACLFHSSAMPKKILNHEDIWLPQ